MTSSHPNPSDFVEKALELAVEAGDKIMEIYQTDFDVALKDDQSPVTLADQLAEEIILKGLQQTFQGLPIVAEEEAAAGRIPDIDTHFALVDPLDGTREFLNRNGAFTVNIALIEKSQPIAGVVHAPALERTFIGDVDNGAFEIKDGEKQNIFVRQAKQDTLCAVASRSHRDEQTNQFIKQAKVQEIVSIGSSLKFCLLAAGEADIYPRFGRTMEWDTAAGHAVLRAAGGSVTKQDDTPFLYGKRNQAHDTDFANPAFIARGDLSTL